VHEDAGPRDGCGLGDEVLGSCEPLVAESYDLGAKGSADEVWKASMIAGFGCWFGRELP